tara:strand:- start:1034 stop:1291 length:258 start_codon:yes stop_codon:yes gene_type:complete
MGPRRKRIGFHDDPIEQDEVMKTDAKFLTAGQLSKVLGLSESWIEFYRVDGRIPFVYDGGWRFPAEKAVEAAISIAQCCAKPNET